MNGRCVFTIYCKPNISALNIGIARDLNILKPKTAGNVAAVETGAQIDFIICVGKSAVAWVCAAVVTAQADRDLYGLAWWRDGR